jgi:hypothetical protein
MLALLRRQAGQRIPIFVNRFAALYGRGHKSRLASDAIIGSVRGSKTLAATAREVDDELGRHKAGDRTAELLFEG